MPKSPEPEGSPRLMTVSEIAEEHGVSRVSIHTYRRRGDFPQPVEGEGTTRLRFRADEVAAFFAANPKQPGKRTDLASRDEGAPMPATEHPQPDIPETDTLADRLANVLAYQTGLAVRQLGLSEEQGEQLRREVFRAVYEVASGWEEADG